MKFRIFSKFHLINRAVRLIVLFEGNISEKCDIVEVDVTQHWVCPPLFMHISGTFGHAMRALLTCCEHAYIFRIEVLCKVTNVFELIEVIRVVKEGDVSPRTLKRSFHYLQRMR